MPKIPSAQIVLVYILPYIILAQAACVRHACLRAPFFWLPQTELVFFRRLGGYENIFCKPLFFNHENIYISNTKCRVPKKW